jgi:5'-nucleotidase
MGNRILITNDDGIGAPALLVLERELRELGRTTVVAPDREMSAQSHSITLNRPLRFHPAGSGRFAVDGTPADCVILACLRILKERPDLLISGINRGRNVGDAILYSGTIAGASEGVLQGIPSMAVSLEYSDRMDYASAAEITAVMAHRILEDGLPPGVLLNVNVPFDWNGGVVLTRQGEKAGKTVLVENMDPRGEEYFWLHEESHEELPETEADIPTDAEALADGYASVTPLQLDRTAFRCVRPLSKWTDILDTTLTKKAPQ